MKFSKFPSKCRKCVCLPRHLLSLLPGIAQRLLIFLAALILLVITSSLSIFSTPTKLYDKQDYYRHISLTYCPYGKKIPKSSERFLLHETSETFLALQCFRCVAKVGISVSFSETTAHLTPAGKESLPRSSRPISTWVMMSVTFHYSFTLTGKTEH